MTEMGLEKVIKYYLLGKSLKEIEANRILDKISKSQPITEREKRFLDLYNHTTDDLEKDFMYLSKNTAYERIRILLESKKSIICNLYDRDGKIGLKILSIENNFNSENCVIFMTHDTTHMLEDRFLYNLVYNTKKDRYSLEVQDEYFEKINAKND